jgi:predicted nucleic acid-binding protein
MRNECFLDTNVLIYAASTKIDDAHKYEIAEEIVRTADFCLSGQVLAEFVVNLRKRIQVPPSLEEIGRWVDLLSEYPVTPVDADLIRAGLMLSERYKIGYWDAAIIAAADRLEAPILYSEDLSHGQKYGSVTVINPFKAN